MAGRPPGVSTYYPRYGTVRSLLWFGLFYLAVGRATGAVVETLRAVDPSADPALVRLGMAASLWIVLAAVAVGELRRQARGNPEEFLARQVLVEFADQHRPAAREHVGWLLAALAGGAVARLARERFFGALDDALLVGRRLAEQGTLGPFSRMNLAWGVAFLAGFALVAHAADRVVVGGAREAIYRYYRRRVG